MLSDGKRNSMNTVGKLDIRRIEENEHLLSASVLRALNELPHKEVGVVEIDPALSDTAAFCEKYDVDVNVAANCVILEAKRADTVWYAACVILGSTRADVNGLARRTLDARKVSFARMEDAVAKTGMEYGAITPVGLPSDWPILIDAAVAAKERLIIGSGVRNSKLLVSGAFLASLPNVQVLESLGQSRQ